MDKPETADIIHGNDPNDDSNHGDFHHRDRGAVIVFCAFESKRKQMTTAR